MSTPLFKPRPLSGWVLAALLASPSVQALDLLQTWEQARQHDPQMQVVQATRSSVQAYEAQAKALWRPVLMGSVSVGAMSADTSTQGAKFSSPSMQFSAQDAYFATSASAATSTRWSLQAKQALYSPERQAQQAQLQKAASVAELRADWAQQQFMQLTAQRYFNLLVAERQQQVLKNQYAAVSRSLTEVKDRFALGDLPVTDTHEATARATGLQAQLLAAESDVQMARSVLAESTRLSVDAPWAWIIEPVADSPTNAIARISGCSVRAEPTPAPSPGNTLNTPSGRPASVKISASFSAVNGVTSLGLKIIALPAASAGAAFHSAIWIG